MMRGDAGDAGMLMKAAFHTESCCVLNHCQKNRQKQLVGTCPRARACARVCVRARARLRACVALVGSCWLLLVAICLVGFVLAGLLLVVVVGCCWMLLVVVVGCC